MNRETGEVHDPLRKRTWFSEPLKEGFFRPEAGSILPTVHEFFHSDSIVIVNCLDALYGHSLLKLLNVQRHLDQRPDLGCCVLVPTQLAHLVPDGVAEIWEFPEPIKDGRKWYQAVGSWIQTEISTRRECFLSRAYSHPGSSVYHIRHFARNLPDVSAEIAGCGPVILYSYREDRLWGDNAQQQEANLQGLYGHLSDVFPDMAFVLVGFGLANRLTHHAGKIIDLRCDRFDRDLDRRWLAFMSASDCCVGVHGSNMLLPSGLAKSTVELVFRDRLLNMGQDLLFPHDLRDIRTTLLTYQFIHGNDSLTDVVPETVADVVKLMVSFRDCCLRWLNLWRDGEAMPDPAVLGCCRRGLQQDLRKVTQ